MNFSIRQSVSDDKPEIEALFCEMLRTVYQTDSAEGYEAGYLGKFFAGSADRIFADETDGVFAGYISVEVYPEHIYLDDLSVSGKFRNSGIGTALIKTAEKYAEDIGIFSAELHVEKENGNARCLYERLGYSVIAEDDSRFCMKKDLR